MQCFYESFNTLYERSAALVAVGIVQHAREACALWRNLWKQIISLFGCGYGAGDFIGSEVKI